MLKNDHHDASSLSASEAIQIAITRRRIKRQSIPSTLNAHPSQSNLLWVDKYSPRRFTDLISADSTNTTVLKWCTRWKRCLQTKEHPDDLNNIILLSGEPGCGKTTLAHTALLTCGFRIHEINASEERSGGEVVDKVRNSISHCLFGVHNAVIIDEIDGLLDGSPDSVDQCYTFTYTSL